MLTKIIDGKELVLTEKEERQQRAFWALNDKHPEYVGHCGWDGVNEPFHDMVECRKLHAKLINKAYESAKEDLSKKIEIAQEEGNDVMEKSLIEQRKNLRSCLDIEFSSCNTVDELKACVPKPLQHYWR